MSHCEYRSFLELQQYGSHIIATIGISLRSAGIQIPIEEAFQAIAAIELLQLFSELLRQLLVAIPVFLPNTVAADNQQLLLASPIGLDYVRHAGYRLLVEGQSFHLLVAEVTDRTS